MAVIRGLSVFAVVLLLGSATPAERVHAAERSETARPGGRSTQPAFDTRRLEEARRSRSRPADVTADVRSVDGSGNNGASPDWGAAASPFLRLQAGAYGDGVGSPAGGHRPGAREVSNGVFAQAAPIPNEAGVSDFIWIWGQFLDHDLDLTAVTDPAETFDVPVPPYDPWFDPEGTGGRIIPLERSFYVLQDGQREQINLSTAWLDASQVYGSSRALSRRLRALDGTGRLRTGPRGLLPFEDGSTGEFLAGDARVNEQVGLTAMHTLFVREHNQWARYWRERNPGFSDEEAFQAARMMVIAEMQAITYREFLPLLLGASVLPAYEGYRSEVNPGIANEFATAAFRFGHSMVSPNLLRLGPDNRPLPGGPLALRAAFFNPGEIAAHGIEPLLRGFVRQRAQRLDALVIDDLRNFLFGMPDAGGMDLVSLNIQRGRDHGLPSFNDLRRTLGLDAAESFEDPLFDPEAGERLAGVYTTVEDVDLWVGGLSERPADGALVGETIRAVLTDQFVRLRDGDRFWYERVLPAGLVKIVEARTLSRIIRANTGIADLPVDVFHVSTGKPERSRRR